MNRRFRYYILIWAILLVVFNVISFVVPAPEGMSKYTGSFWAGYLFIMAAFIGQLQCANIAFKAENIEKLFYNMPLITISYAGLVIMWIAGAAVMAVPGIPAWVGIIVCLLILALTAIAVIKARWAAEEVQRVEGKVTAKTTAIKGLIAEADGILSRAKSPAAKEACRKVQEALRYSDPVSSEDLSLIEAKIKVKLAELSEALGTDDETAAEPVAEELLLLIADRNRMCMAGK